MTHVSKKELPVSQQQKLFSQFVKIFAAAGEKESAVLFSIICSETEQLMLMKRVAAIVLIDRGFSTYAIAKTLCISDSTARIVRSRYGAGEYEPLLRMVRKKQFDSGALLKTLEMLLRAGMPEQGKNRWRFLDT